MTDLFVWPEALPVLLVAPVVWFALRALDRARARRLAALAGPRLADLVPHRDERAPAARRLLLAGGLFLALVAMLGPVWGDAVRAAEPRGVDVLVCLDVSRSMLARDEPPSRLACAKREIRALTERARGERMGLVVFAGEARQMVPRTQDGDTFAAIADTADTLSVRRGGTDLGAALDAALETLAGGTGEHGAILLLTDGEDLGERGLAAAQRCRQRGIAVHCVAFGTPLGGKIPVERDGREAYVTDRAGGDVVSAMDAAGLRRIADATGGDFVRASAAPRPLVGLYERRLLPMARKAFDAEQRRRRESRFELPLLAAFALWMADLLTLDRRRT